MGNLATIQRIKEFKKHPNADRLNIVKVLGWQCVTAETYEVDDLVVYIQVDTTVPKADWSGFLFKGDEERARIKSIRLRKEISQGLVLPLSVLGNSANVFEGQDVTEVLGVQKYEKPIPINLTGEALGRFPSDLVSKTDEERLQNFPELLSEMQYKDFYITVKMDGSSGTFIKDGDTLRVCSRNLELKESEGNIFWKVARKYDLQNVLKDGDVIQGEVVGPKIQKNPSGEPEVDMYVFNYGTIYGKKYFGFLELHSFVKESGLKMVPIMGMGCFTYKTIEELLDLADSVKYDNGKQAEGIVIRPLDEIYSEVLNGRLSFKVISNKYAIKNGE